MLRILDYFGFIEGFVSDFAESDDLEHPIIAEDFKPDLFDTNNFGLISTQPRTELNVRGSAWIYNFECIMQQSVKQFFFWLTCVHFS